MIHDKVNRHAKTQKAQQSQTNDGLRHGTSNIEGATFIGANMPVNGVCPRISRIVYTSWL